MTLLVTCEKLIRYLDLKMFLFSNNNLIINKTNNIMVTYVCLEMTASRMIIDCRNKEMQFIYF